MNSLLSVRNLRVEIPVGAGLLKPVRGISLDLNKGETLCIVGESGCGKSLTSLALMGLLPKVARCSGDRLSFGGQDLLGLTERQMARLRGRAISMVFQEPMTSLNPAYTIGDQLIEGMIRHDGVSRAKARDRAIFLLEKVGITAAASRLSQFPHQLSGGLRQRVMIAMSLMCGPDLIIADEPTTALDVTIQAKILRMMKDLQAELGMAMVFITHDLGVVARIADRIAVMYAGIFVETGTARQIFDTPTHPYTKGLLSCLPVPGKTKLGARLGAVPGVVPALIGGVQGCGFASRCPLRQAACDIEPELSERGDGHSCRCVHDTPTLRKAEWATA
ncbi:MAG: ABC transporter ATP-binding protein [Rhodobacteraceae bacterium]|nr:ABC transporter ATP-binding protein [Paracoccaceae bacterium]MCY4195427.1 ABC transporter ATP-binding protein [Paracoccaceae bacterium]